LLDIFILISNNILTLFAEAVVKHTSTNDQVTTKKPWETPELVEYGDVEEITGEKPGLPSMSG